uniref:Uncharacterized protein n=1 Tax=Leiomenia cribrosa TaxID=217483 RepID=A0A4D6WXF0_9FLOR|nr:hypothetical protein [Leiomenia cribrosa]
MLINLLETMFFDQYIISPRTWIHKINNNMKIFFIFIILLILPYIDYFYIIGIIAIYILIILCLKIPKNTLLKIHYIIFSLFIFTLNIYFSTFTLNKHLFLIETTSIIFKQTIIIKIYNQQKTVFKFKKYYYILLFPKYLIKIIVIYLAYFISLNILYKTTKYENIIIYYLMNYFITKNTKKILIITFASNFLNLVTNQLYFIEISIKLRNEKYIFSVYVYYYALKELLNNIFKEIKRISCILYCREINYKNLRILNIYDSQFKTLIL